MANPLAKISEEKLRIWFSEQLSHHQLSKLAGDALVEINRLRGVIRKQAYLERASRIDGLVKSESVIVTRNPASKAWAYDDDFDEVIYEGFVIGTVNGRAMLASDDSTAMAFFNRLEFQQSDGVTTSPKGFIVRRVDWLEERPV